jgi:outer membrane receptor protein involved in Fe transport
MAQTPTGQISGRVLDPAGAAVPNATVEARHADTGLERAARTDAAGRYLLPALPVGDYLVRAGHPGFRGIPQHLRLEVGRRLQTDLRLTLDIDVVTVEATSLVEPLSAAEGTAISRNILAELPLNAREFLQLALLAPGAHPAAPGSELSRQNNSGLHLNGARESSNNFLLDGVDNNDLFINRMVVSPPLDGVREFRLHSSSYHAEYGRSAGAQVNVVTQAGSNQLHGSLYHYLRNAALDARNFFDGEIPQFQRNQFGGAVGGPLRRNRSFGFLGYEGTRLRQGTTRAARVPTASEKAGEFSQPVIDPFTQRPFPGGRIPAERLDPIGRALAAYWPNPNRADPAQNFVSAPVATGRADQAYGRYDHYLSARDTLYARYNFSHDRSLVPFNEGNTNLPGFGSLVINRGQNVAVSHTHVSSARTLWEARLGFNRLRREVLQQNLGDDVGGRLGIPGLSRDPLNFGFPSLVVAGYDAPGDNTALPIIRRDSTWHAVGSLTHGRGVHTLKAGGEHRRFRAAGVNNVFARGQFTFRPTFTQHPVADLLVGLPTLTLRTVADNPMALRASAWNGYVQDDWRVTPRLTLNLGLRYELNRPAVDAADRFTVYDPARRRLVRAGTDGLSRAGFTGDHNNFAPRAGVSWALGQTVLHAGYGIFYDLAVLEANSGLYFNPPYFELSLFFPSAQRLLTLRDPFPAGTGFQPPASVNSVEPGFRTGYAQHWNLAVERELPARLVARAAYAGSKGTKLLRRRDVNQPAPGPGNPNARRPVAGFSNIALAESASSSAFHSGQLSVERRFRPGVVFSAAYTWAKSLDDQSEFLATTGDQSFPQNSHDTRAERGRSNFDLRHRMVFFASWDLPRGLQFHALGVAQSGPPFTPQLSFDNSNTGNTGGIFGADRPNVAGDWRSGAGRAERWVNPGAFATPPPLSFGNAGRNILDGPGLANLDVALVKAWRLGESARLDLRAEVFNVFNRPNFDLPRRFSDLPTFGRISSAGASRQAQFSLRLGY